MLKNKRCLQFITVLLIIALLFLIISNTSVSLAFGGMDYPTPANNSSKSTSNTNSIVQVDTELVGLITFLTLSVLFVIFCFYMAIKTSNLQAKAKKDEKETLKNKNASLSLVLPHLMGLSVPENSLCTIYSCKDKYQFVVNGATFDLLKSKLTDVSMKTDTEIQQQCVSSIGGAVGGAMLFGPLGAIIGGRAKNKKIKTTTTCLIFTYKKDNDLSFIAFDATNNFSKAFNLVKEYKILNNSKPKEISTIEL